MVIKSLPPRLGSIPACALEKTAAKQWAKQPAAQRGLSSNHLRRFPQREQANLLLLLLLILTHYRIALFLCHVLEGLKSKSFDWRKGDHSHKPAPSSPNARQAFDKAAPRKTPAQASNNRKYINTGSEVPPREPKPQDCALDKQQ